MTAEQLQEILETRLAIAKEDGNPTEQSLLLELLRLVEERKRADNP